MWEALVAVVVGWLLARADSWLRARKDASDEQRRSALAARAAVLPIITELRAAKKMAENAPAVATSQNPRPGLPMEQWHKHGEALARDPLFTEDWIELVAAYEVMDDANKGYTTMDQAAGAAEGGAEAGWRVVALVEDALGYHDDQEPGRAPLRWLRRVFRRG